jgi:hypothetical protein
VAIEQSKYQAAVQNTSVKQKATAKHFSKNQSGRCQLKINTMMTKAKRANKPETKTMKLVITICTNSNKFQKSS